MIQVQTSTSKNAALAGIEGEWIADILRVWDEKNRTWNNHAPIAIRLESLDFIVRSDEDGRLNWETNPPQSSQAEGVAASNSEAGASAANPLQNSQNEDRPRKTTRAATHENPAAARRVFELDASTPSASYEFVRFPALSEAIGARVKHARSDNTSSEGISQSSLLELSLDGDEVLRLSAQKDGTILARMAPAFEAPPLPRAPEASFITADR